MFEQDVAGLIKALRANKNDEESVVQQALEETRKEIKKKDIELKAAAVLKLVYLEMLGYSISFASFAIVECMSSTKYHIKSIGYLAASQCFDKETEVAVLVVNLLKKDLLTPPTSVFSSGTSSLTVSHLLSTLSAVSLLLTPSLGRDLGPEIVSMLSHSRPQVRKQTVLVMWRVVRSWPGVVELGTGREERGEDPWIVRLRERLDDDDMGVVAATVNLICELARKDPRTYLPLAPELFNLMTASTNNWMLIKIIKLFAVLTPEEPRLVKKLVPPLTHLIETTPAMSLLYECLQTSIVGGMLNGREGEALATTCVEKLKSFLEDVDQNLRYIALVGLVKIIPTHPHLVSVYQDTILTCVDDPDMSIRMRALDLVEGMVNRRTLQPMVQRLMTHLRPASTTLTASSALQQAQQSSAATPPTPVVLPTSYRASLITLILRMCSQNTYSNVSNFEWYLDVLVELSRLAIALPTESATKDAISLGVRLRDQLIDVTARVRAIRPTAVRRMALLLGDDTFLENGDGPEVAEVLGAAAWICGEYCQELEDPRPVIASLFGFSIPSALPPHIIQLYIHNGIKLFSYWIASLSDPWDEGNIDSIRSVTSALESQLAVCTSSTEVELQERAAELYQLLDLVRTGLDGPRAEAHPSEDKPDEGGFSSTSYPDDPQEQGGFASTSKMPPKCLTLLSPLFFSHELNPVNPKAQSLVAIPEGLDLDAFVVPRMGGWISDELASGEAEGEVDDYGRPVGKARVAEVEEDVYGETGKKKKGKGKVSSSKKGKRKEEDSEELARMKAERLERQRDDPYYIGTTSAPATPGLEDDVDSIPIVQLSLDFATSTKKPPPPPPRIPTPPPVHVDVDGELPEGAELLLQSPLKPKAVIVEELVDTAVVEEVKAEEGVVTKVVKKKKKESSGKSPKKKKEREASNGSGSPLT